MEKATLVILAVVLISGCAKPVPETALESESLAPGQVRKASESPGKQVGGEASAAPAAIDAAQLLASTLEHAKAEDKRVLVHLGAPG